MNDEADITPRGKEARLRLYKRDEVRRFIEWLLKSNEDIRPKRDPESGDYAYLGVDDPELLSELESYGILEKYEIEQVPSCPSCNHSNFYVDYVCPSSNHRILKRGTMIEHYACGHIDFETSFRSGNELICPKCQRTLRLIGTEYRKTDLVFRCSACSRYFGTPMVELTCRVCGKVVSEDRTAMATISGYRLQSSLRSEVVAHVSLGTQIAGLFVELGYEVTAPKAIRGLSGLDHVFDIQGSKRDVRIVADLVSGVTEIGPESIAGFFAKVFDSKPQRAILVAMPQLSQEAQKLGAAYSLEIVSADEVADILRKLKMSLVDGEPQLRPIPSAVRVNKPI